MKKYKYPFYAMVSCEWREVSPTHAKIGYVESLSVKCIINFLYLRTRGSKFKKVTTFILYFSKILKLSQNTFRNTLKIYFEKPCRLNYYKLQLTNDLVPVPRGLYTARNRDQFLVCTGALP